MHFSNESRKRKTIFSWPLTLIMQKRDHFRLLRHHYSESPVIPLSNDIWYRCVAHGFITFYFLIFYRWSIIHHNHQTLMMVGTYPYLSICHPGSNITHTRHTTHIKDCMFQIVFFWRFYWICSFLYFYIVRNTKSCAYLRFSRVIYDLDNQISWLI